MVHTMAQSMLRILVILFVGSCSVMKSGSCSDLYMGISPNKINSLFQSTTDINVTCFPTINVNSSEEVLMLELRRDQEGPIAILRQCTNVTLGKAKKPNFHVEGHIDRNRTKSHISMTIKNPSSNDAGTYTCVGLFVNEDGSIHEVSSNAALTAEGLDNKVVFDYFVNKISNLEERVNIAENVIREQNGTIASLNHRIEEQRREQDSKLTEQESKLQEQGVEFKQDIENQAKELVSNINRLGHLEEITSNTSRAIAIIIDRENYMVAFSAAYNSKDTFRMGETVVFSKVLMKTGNAYDETTGVFTAPRSGIYVFHLVVTTKKTKVYDTVDITVNDVRKATLFAYDADLYAAQSSVTALVQLGRGDAVKAVIAGTAGANTFYREPVYSIFTGYLVKAT